ncbi:HIT family protein [Vagococcus xieshaowenii]|uniref:HIT family protein n=1 Tax=Vagococcus xieshaowenii TaxID=2562451 RepID=A0AAJ5JL26_9ENTE|nr:HIT family protein [Vagococcus xieshaowenii]QCA29040.1 HIT family protein [Vagococcus xieshaowenii]TFZ40984.1 HIT family protein [Vagococcus xieshaowenii]
MTDCIFCKIISGDIPSYKVYEDEEVLAFLDLSQVTKGHTLVIPKKHVTDIFEYDEDLAATLFARVPKIARALEQAFPDMQGLNIVNNNKALAYQSVFHSHVHLIPRYSKQDGFSLSFANNQADYTPEAMEQIAHAIKKEVN